MKHFTIDTENNITVHVSKKAARETGAGVFSTEEPLIPGYPFHAMAALAPYVKPSLRERTWAKRGATVANSLVRRNRATADAPAAPSVAPIEPAGLSSYVLQTCRH